VASSSLLLICAEVSLIARVGGIPNRRIRKNAGLETGVS
jgi:hypothetical protein